MKNYIKPTFTLAGLAPVAFAASCHVKLKGEYLESLYVALDIPVEDYGNTFLISENIIGSMDVAFQEKMLNIYNTLVIMVIKGG